MCFNTHLRAAGDKILGSLIDNWRTGIAFRYTHSSASDQLVSFMSLISVAGLVLGVAVLVIVLSVMNGFERELRERVLSVLPHGVVFADNGFADWESIVQDFAAYPGVLGAAPYVEGTGLIVGLNQLVGVSFTGVDPSAEAKISGLGQFTLEGNLDVLVPAEFGLVIGSDLAGKLGVSINDRVTLILPDAQLTLAGPLPRSKRFTVVGQFTAGTDADKNSILMHHEDAQRLLRLQRVSGIRVSLEDLFEVQGILPELAASLNRPDVYYASWMRRYGNLYNAISIQKSTMFLLLSMLIAVAAFNVVSNLVMVVNDKRSDIAILRTMGAHPSSILKIFVIHGALVGALGVSLGVMFGVVISYYVSDLYLLIESQFGLGLMDEYFVHYLPSEILLSDVVLVACVSMIICLCSSVYPAYTASKADPVECLQYDA
jgi:lipoprotein-releasing system permease protein